MKRNAKDQTLVRVGAIFGHLRKQFIEVLPSGTWQTAEDLNIGPRHLADDLLRNLATANMLERRRRANHPDGHGWSWEYTPTHGGYELLASVDRIPTDELRRAYAGHRLPQVKQGQCAVCQGRIKDRRVDAEVCWGCECLSKRVEHGQDHIPRSSAYMGKIGATRAAEETVRIRAAHKVWLARRPVQTTIMPIYAPTLAPSPAYKRVVSGRWSSKQANAGSATTPYPAYTEQEAEVANLKRDLAVAHERIEAMNAARFSKEPVKANGSTKRGTLKELLREIVREELGS